MAKNPIGMLRSYMFKNVDKQHYMRMDDILNEIEAQYMRLPVDADGVPIRPGDTVSDGGQAIVVTAVNDGFILYKDNDDLVVSGGNCWRRVKSDTIELELARFLSACGDDDPYYYNDQIEEFAERIRKAVHDGD